MIVGLVAITPGAGFVNGWGAIAIGAIASSSSISRTTTWPCLAVPDRRRHARRRVHARLRRTHGRAARGAPRRLAHDPRRARPDLFVTGSAHLLKMQALRGPLGDHLLRGRHVRPAQARRLLIPLRMSDVDMETGDLAVHGHEVYPSDVPSLGLLVGHPGSAAPAARAARGAPPPRPGATMAGIAGHVRDPRRVRRTATSTEQARGIDGDHDHRLVRRHRQRHRRTRPRAAASRAARRSHSPTSGTPMKPRPAVRRRPRPMPASCSRRARTVARSRRAAPCRGERLDPGGAPRAGGAPRVPT